MLNVELFIISSFSSSVSSVSSSVSSVSSSEGIIYTSCIYARFRINNKKDGLMKHLTDLMKHLMGLMKSLILDLHYSGHSNDEIHNITGKST